MMKPIYTKRLMIRKIKLDDAEDMFSYATDPDIGPLAGWLPHKSILETKRIIEQMVIKDDVCAIVYQNKMVGTIGIHKENERFHIGYVLNKSYWHLGIMREACVGLLIHIFNFSEIEELFATTFIENIRSQKVLEYLGFTKTRTLVKSILGHPRDLYEYKLNKASYERRELLWQLAQNMTTKM